MNLWWNQQSSTPLSVWVGPAVDVLENVMDFTPAGRNTAAGDDAAAVAQGDRAALVPVEDALFGAEAQDASVVAERDPLDDAGAPDVQRGRHSERHVAALRVRVPLATLGVLFAHRHDEGRCGTADRRQQTTGCRDRQRARERIVLLLRPGAEVERDHRVVGFAVCGGVLGESDSLPGWVVVCVEDPLQLGGDLGHEIAPARDARSRWRCRA